MTDVRLRNLERAFSRGEVPEEDLRREYARRGLPFLLGYREPAPHPGHGPFDPVRASAAATEHLESLHYERRHPGEVVSWVSRWPGDPRTRPTVSVLPRQQESGVWTASVTRAPSAFYRLWGVPRDVPGSYAEAGDAAAAARNVVCGILGFCPRFETRPAWSPWVPGLGPGPGVRLHPFHEAYPEGPLREAARRRSKRPRRGVVRLRDLERRARVAGEVVP